MGKLVLVLMIPVAFALGVYVGRMPAPLIARNTASPATSTVSEKAPPAAATATEGGTTIKTASLSAGQQKLLSVLGINASEIEITPTMVACAEAKIGAARLKEIEGGASPTFTEGLSLLACYK